MQAKSHSPSDLANPRVVIVGSGFGGLGMGIRLKRAGNDNFVIYEQAGSLGGTWRDNDYPGAACDVQSHLYSFSFEPHPGWSRMFAQQSEIRQYLNHCADKYDLRRHLHFDTRVTHARWDAASSTWTLTVGNGEQVQADVLVTATGGLSRPSYPQIPGLGSFQGKLFHSARWDHSYELAGKTVGVIGTGASAIQFVPQIAPRVKQLQLFQRTPPWIVPKPDRAIGRFERWLYAALPPVQWLHRLVIYWLLELRVLGFVFNPKIMEYGQRAALQYLERSVPSPELRAKLTPRFTFGCKRVLISNDYYPALLRPNVELVTTAIREVTKDGIVTSDGERHALDAIILGTGFQAAEAMAPFAVHGREGLDLSQLWNAGAEAYLGTTVAGFPNFFMLSGPNTSLGHSSVVFMLESQFEHIMCALAELPRRRARWVEVRAEVQRRFNGGLQERLQKTVWSTGCKNWYLTRTGKNTTLWPGFTFSFRKLTRNFDAAHYSFAPVAGAACAAAHGAAAALPPSAAGHADRADR
jgi:cation diffusion facilitator CzcD-associated flavoprotein CzcO